MNRTAESKNSINNIQMWNYHVDICQYAVALRQTGRARQRQGDIIRIYYPIYELNINRISNSNFFERKVTSKPVHN